jgi:hypothetical protein
MASTSKMRARRVLFVDDLEHSKQAEETLKRRKIRYKRQVVVRAKDRKTLPSLWTTEGNWPGLENILLYAEIHGRLSPHS